MGSHSFVLADISNLSSLLSPLKSTHRIKYTCFNVSQNFIIFGATSGGLYVFKREPCSFLQLLPNKVGSITHVSISPNEKHFVFATVKGAVCVLEGNAGSGVCRVLTSSEHLGSEVTALHWNGLSSELYIGDNVGKISVISVAGFVVKNMFQTPTFPLMQLDSRIVQLDWQSDLLLVSTLTRSYLCDTIKEQYRQIGHKLREGEYGGCFYIVGDHTLPASSHQRGESWGGGTFISLGEGEKLRNYEGLQNLKLFCARPGSRLWDVQADGTVVSTHQFKQALAVPPTPTLKLQELSNSSQQSDNLLTNSTNNSKSDIAWSQQSFNFAKLLLVANKYIFTFKKDGIYIFDPEKASVVLWNNEFIDIVDAQTYKDVIYVWTSAGNLHALTFSPLEKFLIRLYMRKQYVQCAQLCQINNKFLMQEAPTSTKLHLLADLGTKLSNNDIVESILPLLQEISKHAQENRNVQRLDSGIFVVGNHHFLLNEENKASMHILPETKRADRFKEKSRSLSASPETTNRKKMDDGAKNTVRKSESSSSLPELGNGSQTELPQDGTAPSHPNSGDTLKVNSNITRLQQTNEGCTTSDSNSQEALQALKDIGQSVSSKITSSTKTLKEKWHVLEDKMKLIGQETLPEPFDVRPVDYKGRVSNVSGGKVCDNDLVHSVKPKSNLISLKSISYPKLNVSNITSLCKQISKCDISDIERLTEISFKLFDNILYVYEKYLVSMNDSAEVSRENGQNRLNTTDSKDSSNESVNYFLTSWCEISFPFQHYFYKGAVKIIREKLHDSLKSKLLVLWLQKFTADLEMGVDTVEQLSNVYPSHVLKLDVLLSRFLVICSDLLDPYLILQCLEQCQIPCHYRSFCTVLDKYQEGALGYVEGDRAVDDSCWEWPLPLLLNAMFFMLRMDQIETCSMMGKKVGLKDVCYLVLRLQQQLIASGEERGVAKRRCFSLFLSYFGKSSDLKCSLASVLQDKELSQFVMTAFETVNDNAGQSCQCGFPLPLPADVTLQFGEIGETILLYYWQTNHDRQLQMCRRVPVMWRHLLSFKQGEDLNSALPLLIQLGVASELENRMSQMTPSLWKKAVNLLITLQSGKCLSCGADCMTAHQCARGLTLSAIGALMIKSLGPQSTIDLFMKFAGKMRPGDLDARFFQSCIYSTIIDSHTSGLRPEVVDFINGQSSASQKTALFSLEVGSTIEEALAQDLGKTPSFIASSVRHHWGARVDLSEGSCPCCALPLGSEVLVQDGGLMVFQCGHSYHAVCLKQRRSHSCPICSNKS